MNSAGNIMKERSIMECPSILISSKTTTTVTQVNG